MTGKPAREAASPEAKAAAELMQAEIIAAQSALMLLTEKTSLAHLAVRDARRIMASAWEAYHAKFPPMSRTEAAKACFARQRETAQAIKDGTLVPRGRSQP